MSTSHIMNCPQTRLGPDSSMLLLLALRHSQVTFFNWLTLQVDKAAENCSTVKKPFHVNLTLSPPAASCRAADQSVYCTSSKTLYSTSLLKCCQLCCRLAGEAS